MNIINNIVEIVLPTRKEPHRFHVCPGDWVCLEPDCLVRGDVPLKGLTTLQALEREAFTGKAGTEVTGWIRTGDIALVVAVDDDEAYLWSREGSGRGWIDRQFICSIHDVKSE
jgi:hypothetical protein